MKDIISPLGVTVVDAYKVRAKNPARVLGGWELKPYSIIHSKFREIIFLDADNVPVANPEYLLYDPDYLAKGSIFWPDFGRLQPTRKIWEICEVAYRDEPEFETGQIIVDKQTCWKELNLTMHLNEYSDFYYKHIHGDKDTFHMAWRMLKKEYAMPSRGIDRLPKTMCQHNMQGVRIFQHRNLAKWQLFEDNLHIPGFLYHTECLSFLDKLRELWTGAAVYNKKPARATAVHPHISEMRDVLKSIAGKRYLFIKGIRKHRPILLAPGGAITENPTATELVWWVEHQDKVVYLFLGASKNKPSCRLQYLGGVWKGIYFETNTEVSLKQNSRE
jgi:hypothetical protein